MNPQSAARGARFGLPEGAVYWSERGACCCSSCHVPYPGSDTWTSEGWEEITPEAAAEIARQGERIACEGCGREPSRIVRP